MANLVISSKLFSQVKAAYQINCAYENTSGKVEISKNEKNRILCSCKISC